MPQWSAGLLPAPLNSDPGMKALEQTVNGATGVTDRVYHLYAYGAMGNGATDDTLAIQRCYADVPDGGTMTIPYGRFRFTSGLSFNRNVNIVGVGPGSCLMPDVGPTVDGVTINNTVSASLYRLRLSNFSILSATANCCQDAFVLNRVHDADDINVHVKAAAARDGTVFNGCLSDRRVLIITSSNYTYPYPAGMPARSNFRLKFDSVNSIATQAYDMTLISEGGGDKLYIEDQHSFGNGVIRGVFEGSTGTYTAYAKGCSGLTFADFYGEAGAAYSFTLEDCTDFTLGHNFNLFGQSIVLLGVCRRGTIDGVQTDALTLSSTCDRIGIGALTYGINGGKIVDPANAIYFIGTIVNAGNATTQAQSSGGVSDVVNLFPNSSFERWPLGDAGVPAGLTFIANPPSYVKCGTGLADTTRDYTRYCAKITTALNGDAPAIAMDWNAISGEWVTIFARVKVPSGQPNVGLRLYLDGGLAVRVGEIATTKDAFVWIATSFLATASFSSALAVVFPATAGNFYLSHVGYAVGLRRPRRLWQPPSMTQTEQIIEGQSVTFGTAAPTTGPHRAGDIVINTAPAAGGVDYWRCSTTGTPGTWSPTGIVGGVQAAALADLGALSTTQTSGATYTATEQAMLASIKTDLTSIRTEINTLLANRRTAKEQA